MTDKAPTCNKWYRRCRANRSIAKNEASKPNVLHSANMFSLRAMISALTLFFQAGVCKSYSKIDEPLDFIQTDDNFNQRSSIDPLLWSPVLGNLLPQHKDYLFCQCYFRGKFSWNTKMTAFRIPWFACDPVYCWIAASDSRTVSRAFANLVLKSINS